MLLRELRDSLLRINNVSVAANNQYLIISNTIRGYSAKVHFDEIDSFKVVRTPNGEQGVQIFYLYEGGLVITETDFLFDTYQGPFFTVPNMPGYCTLSGLIDSFIDYCQNPTPSIHTYKNLTFYYVQHYLIDSARAKGFDMSSLQRQLQQIGYKTGLAEVFSYIERGHQVS